MFFTMLGIQIESYEHVLGPPRVSSISAKHNFFRFKPFFNGLIKKLQIVIKVRYEVRFWRGDTHFHTRSVHFTLGTIFYISRAAGAPREALLG